MTKRKKAVIASLVTAVTAVLLGLGINKAAAVYKQTQRPLAEKELSAKQREILLMNYTPVALGERAAPKRAIDATNPLNLVNFYGNEPVETLWSSIPDTQKPFTVLLIIPGHTLLPGGDGALEFLEATADACEQSAIPYAIQCTNGEIATEERLPVAYLESRFAQKHKCFYGLNAAELYNGVTWRGECESNASQYIIDCIGLCAKYGAYFMWTDTNMNYNSGMVLEWFETNEAFYSAFKQNSAYICLLNKESYGNPSTYSCMQGLWLAGLVGNWGVASDWWHWQVDGDKKSLFGERDDLVDNEWDMIMSYPENMYVQSMMLVMSRGGTCFKAEAPNFSTSVGGTAVGGFVYGISPLLDRIISGEIVIPDRQTVLDATKVAVLGFANYAAFNYCLEESNLYPATGRYGIIPLLPSNLRKDEIEIFNKHSILLIDYPAEPSVYDAQYEETQGDTYFARTGTGGYYIHNVENARAIKSAEYKPVLSSASKVRISAEEHTGTIVSEKADGICFYLSNYRTDKTEMLRALTPEYMADKNWVEMTGAFLPIGEDGSPIGLADTAKRTTVVEITGTLNGGCPTIEWLYNEDGSGYQNRPYTHTEQWDDASKTLTITVEHNGIVVYNVLLDRSEREATLTKRDHHYTVPQTQADTSALTELLDTVSVGDKTAYNDYSYLRFNAAYEKAKVILSEGTYTPEEIEEAAAQLARSYAELLDITAYTTLLTETYSPQLLPHRGAAFDALLRETASNLPYVDGRSQSIFYAPQYRTKDFAPKEKLKRLIKKEAAVLDAFQEDLS